MVGSASGASDRSKEAVGMMALHEALRNVCLTTDWTYSVFWTIRPRPRVRGGNGCKVGDDNGSLMLMWEDGYCRGRIEECLERIDGEDPVRKSFSKMSIQLYNYGEGLMGKVASDKCHKWVFKEPSESEPNVSNYWQSSFDAVPPEWTEQFDSGIQTIAVIQAGHGLLQLGSCKIIPEDLHFVLRMRHTFESLGYRSGFYISQLFASTRNTSSSPSIPSKQSAMPTRPIFNWGQQQRSSLQMGNSVYSSPNFMNPTGPGFGQQKDDTHMLLHPHPPEPRMDGNIGMMGRHENEIKWPNGLSFFNALTGRSDDAKLLFNHEGLNGTEGGKNNSQDPNVETNNEFLSLDSQHNKFKKSFTMPTRMTTSSSSTSLDHHHHENQQGHHPAEFRNAAEAGMYSDVMETFLE